jgi:hypothetical protein
MTQTSLSAESSKHLSDRKKQGGKSVQLKFNNLIRKEKELFSILEYDKACTS